MKPQDDFTVWLLELQPAVKLWVPMHRRHEWDDAVQDVLLRALRAYRSNPEMTWPNKNAFAGWLYRVARFAFADADRAYWRGNGPRTESIEAMGMDLDGEQECEFPDTSTATAVATCYMSEVMLDVWQAVIVDGMSHQEAARELRIRSSKVTAAVQQLRAFIADNTL